MDNLDRNRERMKLQVCVFALVMLGLFAVFLFAVPVRTGTPQIFRLRYYALQEGLEGGPLSSSLADFDWRKAFVWRASDTEYRQRQFSQFFEVLTPRLYSHLYYWFGPFMWLPLSLLCVFLIGFMIALVVRQWTGDWLPGIVAGSFWLLTTEVLVGHHAPIRYAKDLATLQILGLISILLAMRGADRKRRSFCLIGAGLVWWLGLFTDEYIPFLFPALAVAFISWPWLKPVRLRLLTVFFILLGIGFLLFWFVLPDLITLDHKEPLAGMVARSFPALSEKVVHNLRYLILNTQDIFSYTFGCPPPRHTIQIILASLSGVLLLTMVYTNRAWRGWWRMILFWMITAVAVGGILLPEGIDILHQHTYYNRPLVALLLVVIGLFTSNIFNRGRIRPALAWLGLLAVCGLLNYFTIVPSLRSTPDKAYLTVYGLDDILQLDARLKSGDLPVPVMVSYPQFRDVTGGVYQELEYLPWHTLNDGSPPWSLYRSLVPRLYIRHFEEGTLRADPLQFSRWRDVDDRLYRAGAKSFYDMPGGTVWDLSAIREDIISPGVALEWRSDDGAALPAAVTSDLLGEAPFIRLDQGKWRTSLETPVAGERLAAVVAVRHDGAAGLRIISHGTSRDFESDYGWSWRLFAAGLEAGHSRIEIILGIDGQAEVIGPVIVPAGTVSEMPPHRRAHIPPAGVPLLRHRGRVPR